MAATTVTLVTFDLNGRDLPDKCSLRFWLELNSQYNDPSRGSFVSGTGLIDVFSSLQPMPKEGSKGWGGPDNQRTIRLEESSSITVAMLRRWISHRISWPASSVPRSAIGM